MRIIYEDKDLLVADKTAGIETIEIPEKLGKKLFNIHRLDKDTSGVNLFAKSQEALIFFQKQFINREIEKKYLALVSGSVKNDSGTIETLIGRSKKDGKKQRVYLRGEPGLPKVEREAVTEYRVLKRYEDYTLLEIMPKTGRKHQIRCHMAYLGHPVVGDKIYGFKKELKPADLSRQFLHASYIKIKIPNGEYKEFNSKLPEDLEKCLPK
jgi:23S rRNA pseudouridine1911/1915/1917 synthase